MFEKFKKLTIKGGYFEENTTLELFKNDPVSVVYGRNGSGKTTIAKALYESTLTREEEEGRPTSEFQVHGEEPIPYKMYLQVFVFNEDFVEQYVKVKGEGVNSIVMLGEQVELDRLMEDKQKELDSLEKQWDELQLQQMKLDSHNETGSPFYYEEELREGLRMEGGWAEIDSSLKGKTGKSRITAEVINRLLNTELPKEPAEEIGYQLDNDLELYKSSADQLAIDWKKLELNLPDTLDEVAKVLQRQVENPELNERERRLLALLTSKSTYPQHFSPEHTRTILDEHWEFCPLCLREINDDAAGIEETLKHLLNHEADEYIEELNDMMGKFVPVTPSIPALPNGLNQEDVNASMVALGRLNVAIGVVRSRIELRKSNVYERMRNVFTEQERKEYVESLDAYKKCQDRLEARVAAFNKIVNDREQLKERIIENNYRWARKFMFLTVDCCIDAYKKRQKNLDDQNKNVAERNRAERELKELRRQRERTDIALDYINNELKYVFFSDKKVRLEQAEGCYRLKINGKNVRPNRISVGERNVLGLCYFFAKLFGGESNKRKYETERLIVIDDPVSSFDYGNRVGVMSLLRYQFNNIVKGNANSRILVLSHDLHSVFDLVKIRSDIQGGRGGEKKYLELENRQLKEQDVRNEYKKLLMHVYEYARNPQREEDENAEMSIGNIMRRLMEAYASFCYNTGFEKMMCREGVLNGIPKEKRAYYENFMCRLTLNGLSHEEENVYSLDAMAPYFTKEEKVQTAKTVLLFLMYVNEEHLRAYCEKNAGMFDEIKSWMGEEETWIQG